MSFPTFREPIYRMISADDTATQELEILERYRATGENCYFEKLYLRTRRSVFLTCLKILRDHDLAKDATQEAFMKAYQQFSSLQGDRFGAWVARIAANLSINRIRQAAVRAKKVCELPPHAVGGEADPAVKSEKLGFIRNVLNALRHEQRRVLLLKYVDGCSYEEIEDVTGFTREEIRSYLQNGRRNFRIRWQRRTTEQAGVDTNG